MFLIFYRNSFDKNKGKGERQIASPLKFNFMHICPKCGKTIYYPPSQKVCLTCKEMKFKVCSSPNVSRPAYSFIEFYKNRDKKYYGNRSWSQLLAARDKNYSHIRLKFKKT
jgi:NMD protein affecting ribosome stability and mRNA decay